MLLCSCRLRVLRVCLRPKSRVSAPFPGVIYTDPYCQLGATVSVFCLLPPKSVVNPVTCLELDRDSRESHTSSAALPLTMSDVEGPTSADHYLMSGAMPLTDEGHGDQRINELEDEFSTLDLETEDAIDRSRFNRPRDTYHGTGGSSKEHQHGHRKHGVSGQPGSSSAGEALKPRNHHRSGSTPSSSNKRTTGSGSKSKQSAHKSTNASKRHYDGQELFDTDDQSADLPPKSGYSAPRFHKEDRPKIGQRSQTPKPPHVSKNHKKSSHGANPSTARKHHTINDSSPHSQPAAGNMHHAMHGGGSLPPFPPGTQYHQPTFAPTSQFAQTQDFIVQMPVPGMMLATILPGPMSPVPMMSTPAYPEQMHSFHRSSVSWQAGSQGLPPQGGGLAWPEDQLFVPSDPSLDNSQVAAMAVYPSDDPSFNDFSRARLAARADRLDQTHTNADGSTTTIPYRGYMRPTGI